MTSLNFNALNDLDELATSMKHGTMSLTIKVHAGKISFVENTYDMKANFSDSVNSASLVLAELKDIAKNKQSGVFGTKIEADDGLLKSVSLQRSYKKSYPFTDEDKTLKNITI